MARQKVEHAAHKTVEPRCSVEKREYQARRRQQLHYLYFKSPQEREEFQALAELAGYGHDFNAWLLLKIHAALSGTV